MKPDPSSEVPLTFESEHQFDLLGVPFGLVFRAFFVVVGFLPLMRVLST